MASGTVYKGPITFAYGWAHTINAIGSVAGGTQTPDLSKGAYTSVTTTAGTMTVAAPLNPYTGARIAIDVTNSSGGALTITWNAVFKQAATAPANGKRRVFEFVYDGTNWVQTNTGLDL